MGGPTPSPLLISNLGPATVPVSPSDLIIVSQNGVARQAAIGSVPIVTFVNPQYLVVNSTGTIAFAPVISGATTFSNSVLLGGGTTIGPAGILTNNGTIINAGTMSGGTWTGSITSTATINGGTISGATFASGAIIGTITGISTFSGKVTFSNGNTSGVTAAGGDNSTKLATTGYVYNAMSGVTPLNSTTGTVTLTAAQYSNPVLVVTGTLVGNVNYVLPTGGYWTVENASTGAFTVTFKTASGTGVVVQQGAAVTIAGDGTNIVQSGGSGPLTIASVALTTGTATPSGSVLLADVLNVGTLTNNATLVVPNVGAWIINPVSNTSLGGGVGVWNPADISTGLTLSSANATVTYTAAGPSGLGVRSLFTLPASGRIYAEFYANSISSAGLGGFAFGVFNFTASLAGSGPATGGAIFINVTPPQVQVNAANVYTPTFNCTTAHWYGVLVDITAQTIAFTDGNVWTNAISIAALLPSTLCFGVSLSYNTNSVTLNLNGPFTYPTPPNLSGFSLTVNNGSGFTTSILANTATPVVSNGTLGVIPVGVSSFNSRAGAVNLTAADVAYVGGVTSSGGTISAGNTLVNSGTISGGTIVGPVTLSGTLSGGVVLAATGSTAVTQTSGDNTTKLATTAYVDSKFSTVTPLSTTTGSTTLIAAQYAQPALRATGALSGNVTYVVPNSGFWLFDNATTNTFTVTVKTSGGTGVIVPQGATVGLLADGTNVVVQNAANIVTFTSSGTATFPTGATGAWIKGCGGGGQGGGGANQVAGSACSGGAGGGGAGYSPSVYFTAGEFGASQTVTIGAGGGAAGQGATASSTAAGTSGSAGTGSSVGSIWKTGGGGGGQGGALAAASGGGGGGASGLTNSAGTGAAGSGGVSNGFVSGGAGGSGASATGYGSGFFNPNAGSGGGGCSAIGVAGTGAGSLLAPSGGGSGGGINVGNVSNNGAQGGGVTQISQNFGGVGSSSNASAGTAGTASSTYQPAAGGGGGFGNGVANGAGTAGGAGGTFGGGGGGGGSGNGTGAGGAGGAGGNGFVQILWVF